MKIVKCLKCNKIIHKTDHCYHCGNTSEFVAVDNIEKVHKNVVDEYSILPNLLAERKYSDVLEMSKVVLKWMPDCSEVFWLRVLASNRCSTDSELIYKGCDLDENPDFYNSMRCAGEHCKNIYNDVRNTTILLQNALKEIVLKKEYQQKINTDILKVRSLLPSKIKQFREELFEAWLGLENIECELHELEMDCQLLTNEYQEELDYVKKKANLLKDKVYKLAECPEANYNIFSIQFKKFAMQSENIKRAMDGLKINNDKVSKYNEILKLRDEQIKKITKTIAELQSYGRSLNQQVEKIETIEKSHRDILAYVNNFNFEKAIYILSLSSTEQTLFLNQVGLYI